MNDVYDVTIEDVKSENDTVSSIFIKPKPEIFNTAKAGQYLLIRLRKNTGWTEFHPFTLTNNLKDELIKITVKKVGQFTTILHSLKLPTAVQVKGPLGTFGKEIDESKRCVFIAGGIGITPFISLLEYLRQNKSEMQITLFWANENSNDLFYLDKLEQYCKELNFKTVLIINTKIETGLRDRYGFIYEEGFLKKEILARYVNKDASFYMCGSPNMQNYIFSQLKEIEIPTEKVNIESIGLYMNVEIAH